MESKPPKVTTNGKHCGLCAYFREDGRCGNPRELNRERGYFEVACSGYDSGEPDAAASPTAPKTHIPLGHLRCRYCGIVLPANEMARGPYGFIRVCKPCKQEMSRRAGKAQRKNKPKTKRS